MRATAQEAVDGSSPYDAARAVPDLVRDAVAYRRGTTGVATSAREAFELRGGRAARTSRT